MRTSNYLQFFLIIFGIFLLFSLAIASVEMTSPTQQTTTSGKREIFNITITAPSDKNITQVNITLPEGFAFVEGSNNTNTTSSFLMISATNISWVNRTPEQPVIENGSSAWFSFQADVPLIFANVSINITSFNESGSIIEENQSYVVVEPEKISTAREFGAIQPSIILNDTNDFEENVSVVINSSLQYTLGIEVINDTASAYPGVQGLISFGNYSQENLYSDNKYSIGNGGCLYLEERKVILKLLVKNATDCSTSAYGLTGGNNTNFTVIYNSSQPCPPGDYFSTLTLRNITNSKENITLPLFITIPITSSNQLNSTYGNATILGNFSANSNYHRFFFNTSDIPNSTMITLKLRPTSQDLDLFLFSNGSFVDESIENNTAEETIIYALGQNDRNEMMEIRIYGNFSSGYDRYTLTLHFTTLNISDENGNSVDLNVGEMNVSQVYIYNVTLKNEGNINLTNTREEYEVYWTKNFSSTFPQNFTVQVPDFATKIEAVLYWNGSSNYTVSLISPSGEYLANSSGKYMIANFTGGLQKEIARYSPENIVGETRKGIWRISVQNHSSVSNMYELEVRIWLNASKFISTNFTQGWNFTQVGTENSTFNLQINITVPNETIPGLHRGYIKYFSDNGAVYAIPVSFNVTTPSLMVNSSYTSSTLTLVDNIGFNRTLNISIPINNTGNLDLSFDSVNFSNFLNLTNNRSKYVNLSVEYPEQIQPNSSALLNVSVDVSTLTTSNQEGIYEGWVFLNCSECHPYQTFNLTVRLNLTHLLILNVSNLLTEVGADEKISNSSQKENMTVYLNVYYVNGTSIDNVIQANNFSIWMVENFTNHTYSFTDVYTDITGDVWDDGKEKYDPKVEVPADLPGGYYNIWVRASYSTNNVILNGTSSYCCLIYNNTGLNITSVSYSTTINEFTTMSFNVTIRNVGPLQASGNLTLSGCNYVTIGANLTKGGCGSVVSSGSNTFSLNSLTTQQCWFEWKVYAGVNVSSDTSCTLTLSSTDKAFDLPKTFTITIKNTDVAQGETTGSQGGAATNVTTTTTTIPQNQTTTTTIPQNKTQEAKEEVKITKISPSTPGTFTISNPINMKVEEIVIYVNQEVENVSLSVKETSLPKDVPPPIEEGRGLVLKFLEIKAENLDMDKVSNITIKFRVEKSWIEINKIDPNTIALYKYSGAWEKLPTDKLKEDDNFVYFQAHTKSLSLFAIAGNKKTEMNILNILIFVIATGVVLLLAYLLWSTRVVSTKVKGKRKEKEEDVWSRLREKWKEMKKGEK